MGLENNFDKIRPTGEDFRNKPVPKAFTWADGILWTPPDGFSLTAFKSVRNWAAGEDLIRQLLEFDRTIFARATELPGFLTYWHDDELDENGTGLSFCIWRTLNDARGSGKMPIHQKAVEYIRKEDVYLDYHIEQYQLFRRDGQIVFNLMEDHRER